MGPKLKYTQNSLGIIKTLSELQPQRFRFNRSEWACESACIPNSLQNVLRMLCQDCALRTIGLQLRTLGTQVHPLLCSGTNWFWPGLKVIYVHLMIVEAIFYTILLQILIYILKFYQSTSACWPSYPFALNTLYSISSIQLIIWSTLKSHLFSWLIGILLLIYEYSIIKGGQVNTICAWKKKEYALV